MFTLSTSTPARDATGSGEIGKGEARSKPEELQQPIQSHADPSLKDKHYQEHSQVDSGDLQTGQTQVAIEAFAGLISEYGAQFITHWTYDGAILKRTAVNVTQFLDSGRNVSQAEDTATAQGTVHIDDELNERSRLLAKLCLSRSQVTSQILSSRHRYLLVAAPVPGVQDYAITVLFPLKRHSDEYDRLESTAGIKLRVRDVTIAAALLGVVKLQAKHAVHLRTQPACSSGHPPSASFNAHHQAGIKSELPWSELARMSLLKLRRLPNLVLYRPKLLLSIALLLVAVGCVPFPFTVRAQVVCEPSTRRFVAAPFDSRLLESRVMAGETVAQGQLLAILDGSELRSQIAGLRAKESQAVQRRAAALSAGDASNAELERFEIQQFREDIEVLESRLEDLDIRSPIAGVVVVGDLERVKGSPLSVGENLFEIAPLQNLIAEISIPESQVAYVAPDQQTRITLYAAQGRSHDSVLTRIHPRSELRDGDSVFIADANLDNTDGALRPGMNGIARVSVGLRPIAWILFHQPFEALRRTIGW